MTQNPSPIMGGLRPPYRVSLWAVCVRHQRQNFFSSSRSLVLALFFVVT